MSLHRRSRADRGSGLPSRGRTRLAGAVARVAGWCAPLLLAACASGGVTEQAPPPLFDDAQFAAASEPVDPADVFKLSPAMHDYINEKIRPYANTAGLRQALTNALYSRSRLQLDYDATMTRNAAQAFDARSGNCLSLVIMTGAFAEALGLDVNYQEITTDEMWSRAGDMYFMSGHVNLQLERRYADSIGRFDRVGTYTIDFMPSPDSVGLHARSIGQKTILAMYMNNRAAEAMLRGQLDDAYWRVRDALRIDPSFLSAYNTLGVIYLRHHDPARAERVLRSALEHAPGNPRVMANYAQALHGVGRHDEASAYEARLAAIEPYPPFYFFNRGRAAMQAGDARAARELFKKELERDPDYHEFHYWLALADFQARPDRRGAARTLRGAGGLGQAQRSRPVRGQARQAEGVPGSSRSCSE